MRKDCELCGTEIKNYDPDKHRVTHEGKVFDVGDAKKCTGGSCENLKTASDSDTQTDPVPEEKPARNRK